MNGISWLFSFIVLVSMLHWTSSSNASPGEKIVTAFTGENAILQFEVLRNMTALSIYVKRPNQEKYVYYHQDTTPIDERDQEPRFRGRVRLVTNVTCSEFKCSFSIMITNTTKDDTSKYEASFRDSEGGTWRYTLSLTVTDRGEPAIVWLTLVFTLLILIASICIKTKVMARGTNSRPLRENVAVEKCKEWWRLVPSEKNKQHLRTPTSLDGPETDSVNIVESAF